MIAETGIQMPEALENFALEAEGALCGLFYSLRELYGEPAAFCVADGWLELLELSLSRCDSPLPRVRDITVRSVTCFLSRRTELDHDAAALCPGEACG